MSSCTSVTRVTFARPVLHYSERGVLALLSYSFAAAARSQLVEISLPIHIGQAADHQEHLFRSLLLGALAFRHTLPQRHERTTGHSQPSMCGVVWCGLVWCGVMWCVWNDAAASSASQRLLPNDSPTAAAVPYRAEVNTTCLKWLLPSCVQLPCHD